MSVFDEARSKVGVEDLVKKAGGKVFRAGNELRSACPICKAGEKSGSLPFRIVGEKWRCYAGCGRGGDVVDLHAELEGFTPFEAARSLAGGAFTVTAREAKASVDDGSAERKLKRARETWEAARPFEGSLAWRYLEGRGIAPEVLGLIGDNARFAPFAPHHWDEAAAVWVKGPAMVLRVMTPSGWTGGVHMTFLDRATGGKSTRLSPAKLMVGPQYDAEGRIGGAWLIGPDGEGAAWDLACAEGAETTLSLATLGWRAGRPMRAVAALSLDRLQGGVLRDEEQRINAWVAEPDPARPAFTWPPAPAPDWPRVVLGIDHDMSPVKVKARTGRGKPVEMVLDSAARARRCATLAARAWRRAGWDALAVIAPRAMDFNDELQRVAGAGA